jgi:hypothetical protein
MESSIFHCVHCKCCYDSPALDETSSITQSTEFTNFGFFETEWSDSIGFNEEDGPVSMELK